MVPVGIRLSMLVTADTGEFFVRRRARVALGTLRPLFTMLPRIDLEVLPVVIERGGHPGARCVAGLALMTEAGRDVIRIRGTLKISLMTLIAIGVGELIVSVHMTRLTRCCQMPSVQSEFRRAVIERRRLPRCRGMALRTSLGERGRLMIRIQRSRVVCLMAIDAVRREACVSIVGVTISAEYCAVCPCQLKTSSVVVEGRWSPDTRCVTRLAEMAEIRCRMIRIRRTLEVRLVTLVAVGIDQLVIVVDVARLARRRYVFSGQGEFRGVVVKRRRSPCGRRMALCTGFGKACRLVIWNRHAGVISPMAIDAVRAEPGVPVVHVTVLA